MKAEQIQTLIAQAISAAMAQAVAGQNGTGAQAGTNVAPRVAPVQAVRKLADARVTFAPVYRKKTTARGTAGELTGIQITAPGTWRGMPEAISLAALDALLSNAGKARQAVGQ